MRTLRRFGLSALEMAYVVLGTCAVIPRPGRIEGLNLDVAWVIGIARAADAHLVFGRDIVFSYGPLGYLITSVATRGHLPEMVGSQLAVGILILVAVLHRIRERAAWFQKLLLIAFTPLVLANSQFEMWPSYLVLLVVTKRSFDPRTAGATMLGLGLFSGFFSLTKFTIAIDILLVVGVACTVAAFESRRDAPALRALLLRVAAFACGFFASSGVEFFAIDFGWVATIVLALSVLGAAIVSEIVRPSHRFGRLAFRCEAAAALILFGAATLSPSYHAYWKTSFSVAAAYSSALQSDGPAWQLTSALFFIGAIALYALASGGPRAGSLAVLAYVWSVFKHGFVRQDLHVLYFYDGSLFAALVLAYAATKRRTAIVASLLFVAAAAIFNNELADAAFPSLTASLSPRAIGARLDLLTHVRSQSEQMDASEAQALQSDVLPAQLSGAVGTRSVDIVPYETTYAFANNFDWVPEPMFQSVTASSPYLDDLDLRSLEKRRDDAILYTLGTIDGRYPLGDEPATFRYTLCNYRPNVADSIPSRGVIVLLHATRSRCGRETSGAFETLRWNQPIDIPHTAGALTFARIRIEPNLAGRLLGIAYRAPVVHVRVLSSDRTTQTYRILTANAAEGILMSTLPRNTSDLEALFSGATAPNNAAFSIDADPTYYHVASVAFDSVPFTR